MEDLADQAALLLTEGRQLFVNGAETEAVISHVERRGAELGLTETRCGVTYEHLIVTLFQGKEFRTRMGPQLPGAAVNMAVVTQLQRGLPAPPPPWPRAVVVLLVGMTAACLSHLFGGDAPAFAASWVAASLAMVVRQHPTNPFVTTFLAALVSGLIGGLASRYSATPELCLLAPAMVIVPGVPLVNAVLDLSHNHVTLALSRLTWAAVALLCISLGLGAAAWLTTADLAVALRTSTPSLPVVALLAAACGLGYAALFGIPREMVPGCAACSCLGFTLRAALAPVMSLTLATGLAASSVSLLALFLARRWQAPPALFAYPGVVAMIPGAFAFRAVTGALEWARLGADAPPQLLALTGSLALNVFLLVGAIAVGLLVPALVRKPRASLYERL